MDKDRVFVDLAEHDRDFAAVAEDSDAAPLWHRPCQWRNVVAWLAAVHSTADILSNPLKQPHPPQRGRKS